MVFLYTFFMNYSNYLLTSIWYMYHYAYFDAVLRKTACYEIMKYISGDVKKINKNIFIAYPQSDIHKKIKK